MITFLQQHTVKTKYCMLKGMIIVCMISAAVLKYQVRLYSEERVRLEHKSIQTDGPLARRTAATQVNIEWY